MDVPVAKASIYISVDVEADGPIPGPYSMISLGACVAGRHDGGVFTAEDPQARTFYRELKPISPEFVPEALAVSGLDRDQLAADGADPAEAMRDFSAWVREVSGGASAVFTAYPASFDWMFTYWYAIRFTGSSPFGHSRCLDMKTYFAARWDRPISGVAKGTMPKHLLSKRRHTHNALDDAIEQGEMFANLMTARP
ncbi:exonuclease [Kibdelosporangium phytohabitans]|uniref:Exonuclease n=1 Tax=Kibdelosporangium phytohabitans TaxID=860235 RepID=A0A0N9I068_9PSEU|nr:exonuclease [Kibdelosporangium phytohabitans]